MARHPRQQPYPFQEHAATGWPDPPPAPAPARLTSVKILVAGGFGVGKTTMVGSVSDSAPLHTEEVLSAAGRGVDDLDGVEGKTTTTVALDFGKVALGPALLLYLFGTPGQDRFWFMWDELSTGALGAVVLADPRRLDAAFPSIDFFERRSIPFVVGVNRFPGGCDHAVEEVRSALDVDPGTPVVDCDVRSRRSAKHLLVALARHALELATSPGAAARR